ncbi:hypothetical protein RB595_007213 [Gaeumannomyces hyphopodioides]
MTTPWLREYRPTGSIAPPILLPPPAPPPLPTEDSTRELLGALKGLHQSGDYSDLTLSCGGKDYKLHKSIVCPRSHFFAAACRGHFKEACEGKISLPEDDPQIVDLMVHYFYHLDYHASIESHGTQHDRDLVDDEKILGWELPTHAKVYAMAEKYGVVGLKAVARRKFEAAVNCAWHQSHFIKAAREAYGSTVETDRPLRDAVSAKFEARPDLLNVAEAQNLLQEVPMLAYDVLMLVHQPPILRRG